MRPMCWSSMTTPTSARCSATRWAASSTSASPPADTRRSTSWRRNPPAAMILDVMMPEVDGYDVLEARRERGLAPAHPRLHAHLQDRRARPRAQLGARGRCVPLEADRPGAHRRQAPGPPRDGRRPLTSRSAPDPGSGGGCSADGAPAAGHHVPPRRSELVGRAGVRSVGDRLDAAARHARPTRRPGRGPSRAAGRARARRCDW